MMEALRTWLVGVVLTAFAVSLARELAPGGREGRLVSMAGGLVLLLALLRPLAGVGWGSLGVPAASFSAQTESRIDALEKERTEQLAAIIAERTEAYIWDKSRSGGTQVRAQVETRARDSGIPLPWAVTLTGPRDDALAGWIEEELGIPAQRQNWLEARDGQS